jgi:hypothetical protein
MIKATSWSCSAELIELALTTTATDEESVALNEPTGSFFYDAWKIKDEFKGTAWQSILDTLPCAIGQARIIKLSPGESYQAHADIDNRWHLNLTGAQAFLIDLDSKKMYECKQDNKWYYMDAGKIHAATNYGPTPRLQLVVRELLKKLPLPRDLVTVSIEPAGDQSSFRYKFDNLVSPWLNRMNQSGNITNFSHSTSSVEFKLEREYLSELAELITSDYKLIVDAS